MIILGRKRIDVWMAETRLTFCVNGCLPNRSNGCHIDVRDLYRHKGCNIGARDELRTSSLRV
jgi:hypothetical protein